MMSRQERKLLDDAKRIIMSKKDVPGGMEEIRQVMNTIYKYFKRVITKADFNDKRLVEIFTLERLLKDRYLPLDNEPIYDENREVVAPGSITTEDDCIKMMECIVHRTRKELSELHILKRDSLEKNCIDSS